MVPLRYAGAVVPGAIRFDRTCSSTCKEVANGIAYGVPRGAVFARRWPA